MAKTMTPVWKAKAMIKRWNGDMEKVVSLAKENLRIHRDNKNHKGVKFWKAVLDAMVMP
jgi:hypothetical protein